ncbi:MAG: hypothetical protein AAB255_06135 [Bacteroidota bacterium]
MKYLIFAFLLFINEQLFTQQPTSQMMAGNYNKIESLKKVRVIEKLKLDEAKTARYLTLVNQFQDAGLQNDRKRKELMKELEKLVIQDSNANEIQKLVTAIQELENKNYEMRQKYMTDLKEFLTTKQIGEYVVIENQFKNELRKTVREMIRRRD